MSNEHTHDEQHGDDYLVHAHITPLKTNLTVIGALFVLTGLTIAAYNVEMGEWNLVMALLIASIKATLVGTWFMHLKYEKAFNVAFFVGTLLFMAIFFGYTANDTMHRGEVTGISGVLVDPRSGEHAPGTAPGYDHGEFQPMPAMPAAHGEHGEAEGDEAAAE